MLSTFESNYRKLYQTVNLTFCMYILPILRL
ncbi:unnamed protein product [Cylicostephanus goldi]|uniref:Uncharacterized protein n=1 Tax=Cylicostephanus goldi TaxID=71465 RepID=A0A3P6TP96_CYLGO|nr:unnamed protein product [Cylicostephanus goldi]